MKQEVSPVTAGANRRALAFIAVASLVATRGASATTVTGDFNVWQAHAGSTVPTVTDGIADGATVSSFHLATGVLVSVSGANDTNYVVGSDWGSWNNGFRGNVIDSTSRSDTLTLSPGISAISFYVSPDDGVLPMADTISISLSDGTQAQFSNLYGAASPQFVGIYGGSNITSITISTANASDFGFGDFDPIDEPASPALLALGLLGLLALSRRMACRKA